METETHSTFESFHLDPKVLNVLNILNFKVPTDIQQSVYNLIIDNQDVYALAKTGSGKTGAFCIPLIQTLLQNKIDTKDKCQILVISPTRELAQQTNDFFSQFSEILNTKSNCIIGGEDIEKQKNKLNQQQTVIVGTPGRILDLCQQKVIDLSQTKSVVFDEADRLFDMGFKEDTERLLKLCPKNRQLIMLSATSHIEVLKTAYSFGSNPTEVIQNEDNLVVENINQKIAMISEEEKFPYLVNLLKKRPDSYSIIFCNTQFQTHLVSEWLNQMEIPAKGISGKLSQDKRTRLLKAFKDKKALVLVSTDLAARGLDIEDIDLVVNYDLPNEAANYVHRVGRTARAGKKGDSISFCSFSDCENLESIEKLIDEKIPTVKITNEDFAINICRRPYLDKKTLKVVDRSPKPRRQKDFKGKNNTNANIRHKKKVEHKSKFTKKTFKIESYCLKEAQQKAASHFKTKTASNFKILNRGRKKFFFFGPIKRTYLFTHKRSK